VKSFSSRADIGICQNAPRPLRGYWSLALYGLRGIINAPK
jgi:hypothetical protein